MSAVETVKSLMSEDRFDEVEESWRVVSPLLDAWSGDESAPLPYAAGSWGPGQADEIHTHAVHRWRV